VISQEELSTGTNFTIQRSSENFDMILRVVRTQPNVVFQFTQALTEAQRAIVCRVTQGFSTGFNVILEPTECYGIIRFLSISVPTSASIIALVSMPGLTPLCDHRQLDSERVVIPLISGMTIVGNSVHIPFRRESGGFNTTVRLSGVFATSADGLCGSGVRITMRSAATVACLETVVNNEPDDAGWTAIHQSDGKAPLAEVSTVGVTIPGIGWRLHTFQVPAGTVDVLPSVFTFPEDAAFLHLHGSSVQPFAAVGLVVFVRSDRPLRIEQTCGIPSVTHQVERGDNGLFTIDPCRDTDLLIAAICNDSRAAFCEFTVTLDERTLLKYGCADGVFEVNDNSSTAEALLPGVSRQVIGPRGPVQVYKSWSGLIEQVGVIKDPAKLIVTAKLEGGTVTLSLMFGNLSVPFSPEKYYADPEGFFAALGIAKPEEGYSPETANFTDDGNVEASTCAIDLKVLKNGIDVERTTDLPKELITGQEFVVEEEQGVNLGAIVGGVLGGLGVIAGVLVGIKCFRGRKGESKSSGFMSLPSS
jgi:hypothetical protein